MTDTRKHVGLYLRISQDREGRELGVDRQLDQCRILAASLGWDVVDTYVDNSKGASRYATKRRPEYERMLADARSGRITAIISLSTSRLTRRPRELEDLVDLVEQHGTEIRTVKVGKIDLSSAQGRMLARILAAADAAEAEVNSERSRDERAQRRERGLPNGGTRPFGWEKDGVTPHPVEMPALTKGVQDVLAGVGLRAVSRSWGTAKGSTMPTSTVRRVLLSERIRGRLPDGRPAIWDPAVTDDEAAALRGVLDRPAPRWAPQCLLTGWAACGVCRATVRGAVNRLGVGCYECSATPHLRVPREPRDDLVRQLVAAWLDRHRVVAERDTAPLATRHAALTAQLAEVADMLVTGEFDRAQAARATRQYRAQLAEIEGQLAVAAAESAVPQSGAAYLAMDTDRQRAVHAALPWRPVLLSPGRGVRTFDPETVTIEEVAPGQLGA